MLFCCNTKSLNTIISYESFITFLSKEVCK